MTWNIPLTWEDVPQSEIDKELAYWRSKKVEAIWLVPCRYAEGDPTCSGSQQCPFSADRRLYVLGWDWRQQ